MLCKNELSEKILLSLKINKSYKAVLNEILKNIDSNLISKNLVSEPLLTTKVELNIQELGLILNLLNQHSSNNSSSKECKDL
ncbi:hypothetical protein [Spiroplasma sp. DGKH1]|uniref:hypothetical protein n=1 Tax=Spiroplasma sp. DGKH1 TaxID=3050074 RepID=UPI0034C63CCB